MSDFSNCAKFSTLFSSSYGRHIAAISLHFGRTPLGLEADEVMEYLYELQNRSRTPSQTYWNAYNDYNKIIECMQK